MIKRNAVKKKRTFIKRLIAGTVLAALSIALFAAPDVFRFNEWRDLDTTLITDCAKSLLVYDKEGELISVSGPERRIWIPLSDIPEETVNAFVAAEDARFYSHKGLDVYRIFGAAWADIKAGGYVQGASTISQQLIKLSHLSSEKTIGRKLEEAVLAAELERSFDKDTIMEMYLNYIYFGGGYYGIEAASLGYFGVHAKELTVAQSAQLAGILKSPSAYAPHLDPEASLKRRNGVLKQMLEHGFIDGDTYNEAIFEEPVLVNGLPKADDPLIERCITEATEILGITKDELLTGGYSIHTTYDSEISGICRSLMSHDSLFPSENAQAALAVIDSSGGIAALIGGRNGYDATGLNRSCDIERQPGSLIKPIIVYAPALELKGYGAETYIKDEKTDFGEYSPRNSDDKYYGMVSLRKAVTLSLNVPAVKVLEDVGVDKAVRFAEEMGVSFDNEEKGLSLALGGFTHGVSPLEMAGAYSTFSNEGVYIEPSGINRIIGPDGELLYERQPYGKRVMSAENAFILTSMLESAASEGTGRRLTEAGVPLAAKTGTSVDENGVRDAWCAAYTSELTAVIWMGTDSASMGSLPAEAVGGNNPAVFLAKLFKAYYQNRVFQGFSVPKGVTECTIDTSDERYGVIYLASENTPAEYTANEYFRIGEAPVSCAPKWQSPVIPSELGWSIDGNGLPVISFVAENAAFTYKILRSQNGTEEKQVFAANGKKGYVSFTDEAATPGAAYVYRLIAENEAVKDGTGKAARSEPSRKLRIVVPFRFS